MEKAVVWANDTIQRRREAQRSERLSPASVGNAGREEGRRGRRRATSDQDRLASQEEREENAAVLTDIRPIREPSRDCTIRAERRRWGKTDTIGREERELVTSQRASPAILGSSNWSESSDEIEGGHSRRRENTRNTPRKGRRQPPRPQGGRRGGTKELPYSYRRKRDREEKFS